MKFEAFEKKIWHAAPTSCGEGTRGASGQIVFKINANKRVEQRG